MFFQTRNDVFCIITAQIIVHDIDQFWLFYVMKQSCELIKTYKKYTFSTLFMNLSLVAKINCNFFYTQYFNNTCQFRWFNNSKEDICCWKTSNDKRKVLQKQFSRLSPQQELVNIYNIRWILVCFSDFFF